MTEIYIDDIITYEYHNNYINTYWHDEVIHYMNNQLYYDNNQITNIQYYRIIDFLSYFR